MNPGVRTALRRLVLLGAPLALGLLNLTHPGPDEAKPSATLLEALIGQGQVDWWITLHLVQPILVAFLALAIVFLADGLHGPLVVVGHAGIWAFLIAFSVFDAVAGVASGFVIHYTIGLPADQQVVVGGVLEAVAFDPIVGGATFSVLAVLASLSGLVAVLPVVVALARSGAPRLPLILLGLGTVVFGAGHPAPTGPAGMALFLAGGALLEFSAYGRKRQWTARGPAVAPLRINPAER